MPANPLVEAIASADLQTDDAIKRDIASVTANLTPSWLINTGYNFDVTHPDVWKDLCKATATFASTDDYFDALKLKLGPIVCGERWRVNDGNRVVSSAIERADTIAKEIVAFNSTLMQLASHFGVIEGTYLECARLAEFPLHKIHLDLFATRLALHAKQLKLVQAALYFSTGFATHQHRGRPLSPYYVPVSRFMDVWEEISNKNVPSPKGLAQGKHEEEPIQPAIQFVFQAMKLIDSSFSAANAISTVKTVRSVRKQLKKLSGTSSYPTFATVIDEMLKRTAESSTAAELQDGERLRSAPKNCYRKRKNALSRS